MPVCSKIPQTQIVVPLTKLVLCGDKDSNWCMSTESSRNQVRSFVAAQQKIVLCWGVN
ncbi:Uncharacterised protein [Vibrio cholerae]|nr:Uncharacterised protein [Vibrio cholerae]